MLSRLINKQSLTVLGLNSGTSTDAIDCAVVRVRKSTSGLTAKFLTGKTYRLNPDMKDALLSLADDPEPSLETTLALDIQFGRALGEIALNMIKGVKKNKIKIDLIGSHGQTVRHLPNQISVSKKQYSATCQIGHPGCISKLAGTVVVSDFRQAAIGAGGEGAPITGGATRLLVNTKTATCLINIGGMSNYFYWPKSGAKTDLITGDCGPGNVLSDLLTRHLFHIPYDKNGLLARRGDVSERLLALLLAHPFFQGKTVSTGREAFGMETVEQILAFGGQFNLRPEDMVATAAELTVRAIKQKIEPILKKDSRLTKLYLTGGGRKNIFIKNRLQQIFQEVPVCDIDNLGINGDFVEAAAYAVMAAAAVWEIPLVQVHRNRIICGTISQPPKV